MEAISRTPSVRRRGSRSQRGGHPPQPIAYTPPSPPPPPLRLSNDEVWQRLEENVQRVAEDQDLVEPGEKFTLTPDQDRAIRRLIDFLMDGKRRMLLVAPTGAGKTEVMARVGVDNYLATGRCTVIIVPTRDLSRQHHQYLSDRLKNTGLSVCELHGGVPPKQRRRDIDDACSGRIAFAVGSAMLMHSPHYRSLLNEAGLVVVDDVNAFDERQDLSHLRGLKVPCLFASATPQAVGGFLKREGAYENRFEMATMPFDSPPTEIHRMDAGFGENVYTQLDRAQEFFDRHMAAKSRVYVISRTRAKVPTIQLYLEDRLKIHVSMLHGEMADTKEHSQRQRGQRSVWARGPETRTEMMRNFKLHTPSVMVATNLVGAGLDIPMADLIVITDADHFSESEMEQLIGRVGRRQHRSDAVLITGTVVNREQTTTVRGKTTVRDGRVVLSYGSLRKGRRGRR